jgi:hypothetical protein
MIVDEIASQKLCKLKLILLVDKQLLVKESLECLTNYIKCAKQT